MKIPMILTVALLMALQCRAAAVPWTLEGKVVTPQAGSCLEVPANAVALAPAPALPYEFRFEALVPGAVQEEPDFGTPQIWFSADYRGAQDRLAFALRGGRLQDAMAYDFHQQGWVGVVTGQMFAAENQAFGVRFRRLPDRESAPMTEGKWVSISVRVTPERAGLWVNGKFVMAVDHPHGEKSSVALGGSWQANTFRNVEVLPLAGDALAALANAKQSDVADAVATEKRRQEQRARYAVKALPEAPAAGFAEASLDGDWLFMPEHGVEAKVAPAPGQADGNWHVLPVPGFWNPVGWWIWGQSPRHISRAFLYEDLARCEPFTFDWKKTSGGWYRQHLRVPASYAGKQVCLEFGGVASLCDVYVNGVHAGGNMGMFKPFSVDVTPHLRPGASNLVAVWVGNGEAKWGKKGGKSEIAVTMVISREMVTELPRGIYCNPQGEDGKVVGKRQGGIWQSVRLRVGDPVRFGEIWPRTSGKSLKLKVEAAVPSGAAPTTRLQVRLKDAEGKTVLEKALAWPEVTAAGELQFADLPVALWSPEVPILYSLELELTQQAKTLDKRTLNIGFRDFGIRDGKFVLNGTPWRFLGANMPPHGIRPNDKELAKKFIGFMRQGNQRGVRCHGSPFPPEWLDETDRQGIAVSYEGQWPWVMIGDAIPDEAVIKVWKEEWIALVKANRHRPSIIMWTLNNECYSLEDKDVARRQKKWDIWQDVVKATREADPTRPVVIWSGHTRANQLDKLAALAGPKDDGDIDDRHAYTGTYTPSMLYDPVSYWKDKIKQFKTPGRPFICQEGGTAYANTDVGHQELSYLQTWHGQSWTGRQSYPNASPSYFQARLARITKEQLEITRYQDMEGWLAFCNGTWYHNADRADLIRPYPVHESVRLALQPRLVALMRPPQRVFEGHRIPLQVYGVNDAERNLGTQWQVEVLLENREGAPLSAPGRVVLPEPALGGGVQETPVTVAVNTPGLKARQDAVWHVTAKDAAGRVIAENRYEVGLFPAVTEPVGAIPVLGSKAALREWTARLEKLGFKAGGDLANSEVGVALAPAKGDWTAILQQATSGKRIVVLDPTDLPKSDVWGGAKLTRAYWNGEVAEVTEAGRQRGLAVGLRDEDLAWWQGNGPELGVYSKALTFAKPYTQAIQPLVDHVPPHGYGGSWAMDFPVVRFPVGQGEIVICTLNLSALDRDPAPAILLRNLLAGYGVPKPAAAKVATDFRDPALPVEHRVEALLGQLTVSEKISQLMMASEAIPRLGVPAYHWWSEALHGVARNGVATVFPQAIGLAATWDPVLLRRMAEVVAVEARAKYWQTVARTGGSSGMYQGLTLWSPNINIFRDPRWGRGQETYGEDPFLTATMGVAFVRGIQGNDPARPVCVATLKHFAVHSGPEAGRHQFDSRVSPRDLRETYLPAFEKGVREGGALSLMTAYNEINGVPAPAHRTLLTDVLRHEWGFAGAVVSDVEAVDNIWRPQAHATVKDQAEASALALKAGNDLCSSETYKALPQALERGLVTEADLDVALRRVLKLRFMLGLFDPIERAPHRDIPPEACDTPAHDQLALEVARKCLVLLKNDGALPWDPASIKTVAVLGPTADDPSALLGNYCGRPARPVSILKGLRMALEPRGVKVRYQPAVPLVAGFRETSQPIPEGILFTDPGRATAGLKGELFGTAELKGTPLATRLDANIDLLWNDYEPQPEIPTRNVHLRWTGVLVALQTGDYVLSLGFTGRARLYLGDQLVVDGKAPAGDGERCFSSKPLALEAGRAYPVRIESHQQPDEVWGRIQFGWGPPGGMAAALELARNSDHILLVLGITPNLEGEDKPISAEGFRNGDRTTIMLPKCQRELMDQVAALGKPFTVVLTSGSPLAFDAGKPNAILQAWYYGQRGGDAVAEVLLGKTNPAGRLPLTFLRSDADLPPFEDYSMHNRTYRYFAGTPLYAFGHGLSYTSFRYGAASSLLKNTNPIQDGSAGTPRPTEILGISQGRAKPPAEPGVFRQAARVMPGEAGADATIYVRVPVTNTGGRDGDEVVQVYARAVAPVVPMPRQFLVGFARKAVPRGQTVEVEIPVKVESLRRWDEAQGGYKVDPGQYELRIGGASDAIVTTVQVTVR